MEKGSLGQNGAVLFPVDFELQPCFSRDFHFGTQTQDMVFLNFFDSPEIESFSRFEVMRIPASTSESGATDELSDGQMGIYHSGECMRIRASEQGVRALLLAGTPLREPISPYVPFVINTMKEIEQAIADYNSGHLVA